MERTDERFASLSPNNSVLRLKMGKRSSTWWLCGYPAIVNPPLTLITCPVT